MFLHPDALATQAQRFLSGFPGRVSYAVKANPDEVVLRYLALAGVDTFDVASVEEMHRVRRIAPDARLHYHNPIRSNAEIAEAKRFGVASWSVDRLSELRKLGDLPSDTEIAVRLSLPRPGGVYDFGSKFGATPELAASLLREVSIMGCRPAITFHPGTQCTDAGAWQDYIAAGAEVAKRADVRLQSLNVGGGFPSLVGDRPERLTRIFQAIEAAAKAAFGPNGPVLWCEPGRGMVAPAMCLLLRIKSRTVDAVTLNDGLYGALGEWRDLAPPARLVVLSPKGSVRSGRTAPFTVFGPTCDSLDCLPMPWHLPMHVQEDDYILLDGAGAYAQTLTTHFNGYGLRRVVELPEEQSGSRQDRMAG
ncbi:alanine racemase [Marivita sp. GX14005]|uniref:alanine racemase n=1 Tax=Marivita sp. GX14005 TaxID=2942276 RepID=UPI0020187254|nr:alanine racemase [Marivita sp. GX14005]MCL3882297.1 type III PLP-dependent enzyme [Marivita sp. GX14005]